MELFYFKKTTHVHIPKFTVFDVTLYYIYIYIYIIEFNPFNHRPNIQTVNCLYINN